MLRSEMENVESTTPPPIEKGCVITAWMAAALVRRRSIDGAPNPC